VTRLLFSLRSGKGTTDDELTTQWKGTHSAPRTCPSGRLAELGRSFVSPCDALYRHQMHVDVYCAATARDAERRRVLELGATYVRDGDDPEDAFVVFADPEGNQFCVCPI
jgi:Glyoxalase-like domain